MQRLVLLTLILLALPLASCTKKKTPWPDDKPDINTLKPTETSVQASQALSDSAVVEQNRLVFPAALAAEVEAKWAPGKAVLGTPSTQSGTTNPFGFLRKVKEVRVEGDNVVVDTEPAALEEVLNGELRITSNLDEAQELEVPAGVDIDAFIPPPPSGPRTPLPESLEALGYRDAVEGPTDSPPARDEGSRNERSREPSISVPFIQQAASISANGPTFSVPELPLPARLRIDRPIVFTRQNGMVASPLLTYAGGFSLTPLVSFSPSARLSVETSGCPFNCRLDTFLLSVGGSLSVGMRANIDVSVVPRAADVRGFSAQDLKAMDRAVDAQPVRIEMPEVLIGKESKKQVGTIYGIPVILTTGLYADCQAKVRGTFQGTGVVTLSNKNIAAGLQYSEVTDSSGKKKKKWHTPDGSRFSVEASGSIVSAQGSLELTCGLTLKTALRIADAAGPYMGLRTEASLEGSLTEVACAAAPPLHTPVTANAKLQVTAQSSLEVGAEVTLFKIVSFGVGPFTVAGYVYKEGPPRRVQIPSLPWFPGGYATVVDAIPLWESAPKNFKTGFDCESRCGDGLKNDAETDVDCGGNCGGTCGKGTVCSVDGDCLSKICASGSCRGGPSDNEIKDQGETDVDCGGPSNPLRCALGRNCAKTADCAEGLCSKDLGGGSRICTNNLCLDGVRSGIEGDVDCGQGIGCAALCATGQRCNDAGDCTSGACSVSQTCVEATPPSPNTCADGYRNFGETDVDCGGPCATKCSNGQACSAGGDCASSVCSLFGGCVATACEDQRLNGSEADIDCGGSCPNKCGVGAACGGDTDCAPTTLCNDRTKRCVLPGCSDSRKNGNESAIDCGGDTCSKCAVSRACDDDNDCVSNACLNNKCISGPCENGALSAGEADVDCGGVCGGTPCATGKNCSVGSDCASGICGGSNKCVSDPCLDRTRNGSESDVDCGGACSAKCALSKRCAGDGDCASGLCGLAAPRSCVANTCSDGLLSAGSESDVDCGGTCAAADVQKKCANQKLCTTGADCASGVCNGTTNRCVASTCFDGLLNGNETATDCGGSCEPKCGFNQACVSGQDCQSGSCTIANTCASDQCSDGIKNGSEPTVDCGGACATKCMVGDSCLVNGDCAPPGGFVTGFCNQSLKQCSATSCGDGVKSGNETGVDCGGPNCSPCGNGQGCNGPSDCTSTFCNTAGANGVCVATRCQDGVKNGAETDIDCGGPASTGCGFYSCQRSGGPGGADVCVEAWDCASGYCGPANTCVPAIPNNCSLIKQQNPSAADGVYVIDPDGPMNPNAVGRPITSTYYGGATYRTPPGWDNSIRVYCDMSTSFNGRTGGWTPAAYINSSSLEYAAGTTLVQGPSHAISSWASQHPDCTSDAACASVPGGSCRQSPSIVIANPPYYNRWCTSPNPAQVGATRLGLLGPPANYSVTPGGGAAAEGFNSYAIAISDWDFQGNLFTGSVPRENQGLYALAPFLLVNEYRWSVYRNGSLVFETAPVQVGSKIGWRDAGSIVDGPTQPWHWFQATAGYMNGVGSEFNPGSNPDGVSVTTRGRGFGAYQNASNTVGTVARSGGDYFDVGGINRIWDFNGTNGNAGTSGSVPVPLSGIWFGSWGRTATHSAGQSGYSPRPRIGFCNGFANTCNSNIVVHPDGETPFVLGGSESNAGAGTMLSVGTPGVVIVLWVR